MVKCPHYKKCKGYKDDSYTCNINDGWYGERIASCRIKLENNKNGKM
jgi:hypothetical protein